MTLRIEENNDPLIALHHTGDTCTQGHGEVDRLIKLPLLDTDSRCP